MQQDFLKHLDDAVAEVFDLMLSRSCAPLTRSPYNPQQNGLTASVSFSGTLEGACVVHLDLLSARELTAELTGEPHTALSAIPFDLVGELCNMIAGSWKSRLTPDLSACQLSVPVVTTAEIPTPDVSTVTRFYRFADHCLTLELKLA